MRYLILCLALVTPSWATSYFVAQTGAATCTTSSSGTKMSVATYNTCTQPTGGDTVFFSGTITSQIAPNSSGTGNGAGRLHLDFSGATLSSTVDPVISMCGANFITMDGGPFSSTAAGVDQNLITFCTGSTHDDTVQNFTYTGPVGGRVGAVIVGKANNLTVNNNSFDNVLTCVNAFQGSTTGLAITNNFCRTSNNTAEQTDVVTLGDAVNVTITGNKLINQAPGSGANSRHNDVIQTFHSGSGTAADPTGWFVAYNWIEVAQQDGSGGNMSWNEWENFAGNPAVTVCNNVYVGNNVGWAGGNGASWHNATAGAVFYVYNNTFIQKQSPLNIIKWGQGDGFAATLSSVNNVFVSGLNQSVSLGAPFSYATVNNNFMSTVANCSTANAGLTGSCSLLTSTFTNFAGNDFSPIAGSPLINGGTSSAVPAGCNKGIAPGATWPNPTLNSRVPGAWDAGAYQTAGAAPQLPAPSAPSFTRISSQPSVFHGGN